MNKNYCKIYSINLIKFIGYIFISIFNLIARFVFIFVHFLDYITDYIIKKLLKIKKLLIIISLPSILAIIYSLLCFILIGALGVPIQKTIEYSQSEAYSDMENFEIYGDIIFSSSNQGTINIKNIDENFGKFKYVTIFVSRLSDNTRKVSIRYREKDSIFDKSNITYFNLKESRTSVKIPDKEWTELTLRLGTREDMSMIIDKIILSKFPVLPDFFLPSFLLLSFITIVLWYFIVFCRLGNWFISHPKVILVCFIILQILVMIFYVNQKRWFHIDEYLSYTQANGRLSLSHANRSIDYFNTWNTSEYYLNLLTVQYDERFDFKSVYKTISSLIVHPPFYHLQLHAVSSLFPNTWSKWIGAIINIFWLAAVSIILYMTSKLLIKNKWQAFLPCIIWGFSSGAIYGAVFFRMYATLTFFFTALTYLCILLISGKIKAYSKFYISLYFVLFLGLFTQFYFIIFFALSAFLIFMWLIMNKEFIILRNCIFTVIISLVTYIACWPHLFRSIFRSSRGKEAFNNISNIEGFSISLKSYFSILDKQLFGGNLLIFLFIIIIFTISGIIIFKCKKNSEPYDKRKTFITFFMFFITIIYFLIVVKISPYKEFRYIIAICPTIIMAVIIMIYYVSYEINKKGSAIIIMLISLFLIITNFNTKKDSFLYVNTPDISRIMADYNKPSCIVISSEETKLFNLERYCSNFLYFDKTFLCKSVEDMYSAMNGIVSGQELFLYIHRDLSSNEILWEVNKLSPYQNSRLIYSIGAYHVYRIEW